MSSTLLQKTDVRKEADKQFAANGYQRHATGLYSVELTSDVVGWVGLCIGRGYERGAIDVLPNVGVRHQPLEQLVASLLDEKPHPIQPPTLIQHIGYLMPEKATKHWLYYDKLDLPRETRSLVEAVQEFGLPFMHLHQTLESLLKPLNNTPASIPGRWMCQLPVALLLLGRKREALKLAHKFRDEQPSDDEYRKFVVRLTTFAGR